MSMKLSAPAIGWPTTNPHLIGGGVVRRRFMMGSEIMLAGTQMTAEQIRSIRPQNRAKLIENRFLEVWPAGASMPQAGSTRVIVADGKGKYHVIEGQRITPEPLSKEQAAELARATS